MEYRNEQVQTNLSKKIQITTFAPSFFLCMAKLAADMVPRGVRSLRRALGPGARNCNLRSSFAVLPSQLLKLYRQDKVHILKLVLIAPAFLTSTHAMFMRYTHTCTHSHSHKAANANTTTTHKYLWDSFLIPSGPP